MSKKKSKNSLVLSRRESSHPQKFQHKIWLFVIFSFLILNLPAQNAYSVRSLLENYDSHIFLPLPSPAMLATLSQTISVPNLTAQGIVVIDINSGIVLYEKNAQQKLFPASTTKIMSALVVLDTFKLDDIVVIDKVETEGQSMNLIKNEKINVENLLYGMLVHSANDAAFALAEHFSAGGREGFIAKMNEKAVLLHLNNTHFTNPAGFDDPNHFTTVEDLGRLTLFALNNPIIRKIVGTPKITVSDTNFIYFHELINVNELLGKIPGVMGFKTGYTTGAGQSLVTTVIKDDHEILSVILNSEDRFKETEVLLNWVFSATSWKSINPS